MKLRTIAPAVLVAVVSMAGCGSDDATDSAATMVPVTTAAATTTVLATTDVSTTVTATTVVSTTVVATTAVSTTQLATTVPTTVAPTTVAATTTTPSAAPCDLDLIVSQTNTTYDDVTPTTLRCAGDWASWVGEPADPLTADGFFAVAQWNGTTWELANLGTASICGDGGVPPELWDALGCIE